MEHILDTDIKTALTHPKHETIGHIFRGWDGQLYYCDSFDPRIDFFMTNILDRSIRKDVSVRAIGRTFHQQSTCSKPQPGDEFCGRVYYVVDTLMAPADMSYEEKKEEDCVGLPETHALFCWEPDAKRFIAAANKAAEGLAEAQRTHRLTYGA